MNVGWIVLILFVCTIAELIISRWGFAGDQARTEGAPREHDGAGIYLRGNGHRAVGLAGSVLQRGNWVPYFTWMGIITIATGVLLFLVHKPVRR